MREPIRPSRMVKFFAICALLLLCRELAAQATQEAAQPAAPTKESILPVSEKGILLIYTVGVISIAVSWTAVAGLFAWRNKLDALIDLIRRGPLIKFVTVTYIVVVIVTLGLIHRLEHDDIATLLAAIAGYILGERPGGRMSDTARNTQPAPTPAPATQT